jgi:dephospho-CoA kinase
MKKLNRVVGLTGGVASGKSTIAARFAQHGANLVDVDDVSRELTAKHGRALPLIKSQFPQAFHENELDRAKLREIVFADPLQRKALEAILHPMIRDETARLLQSKVAKAAPYTLLVVPLLFEGDAYRDVIDCAIVVDVPRATQIERLIATRGLTKSVAEQIVNAQLPREARLAKAQFVIDNDASLEAARTKVERLHKVFESTYAAVGDMEVRATVVTAARAHAETAA